MERPRVPRYLIFANREHSNEVYLTAATIEEAMKVRKDFENDPSVERVEVYLRLRYPERSHRLIRDK
jgi:hypothetical protein